MIRNRIELAGNLTDKPSVAPAGNRQFVRGRLAQSWIYETQGRSVIHKQFFSLLFLGDTENIAKHYQKGDNIHVNGLLIRRSARKNDGEEGDSETASIYEIHVSETYPIARIPHSPVENETPPHQSVVRRAGATNHVPAFMKESLNDWPR